MKARKLLMLLPLFVAVAISGVAGAGDGVTFLVTSDSHYDAFENEDRNERNRATIGQMNEIGGVAWPESLGGGAIGKPRGVLVLGDLIDDGDRKLDGKPQSEQQWRYFVADFGSDGTDGRLKYPVFEGCGNHDGPPVGREKHGFSLQAELKKRNEARKKKGRITGLSENGLHYSWDWGPVHFVQLNLYPGDRPHPDTRYSAAYHDPQGSLKFLRADLADRVGDSRRPVVLLHHYDLQGSDWWHNDERTAYYDAVKDYNVAAVFHGHTGTGVYRWKPEGREKELDVVNTGQTENGFFVVEITGNRLRTAYRTKNRRGKEWDGTWTWKCLLERPLKAPAKATQ